MIWDPHVRVEGTGARHDMARGETLRQIAADLHGSTVRGIAPPFSLGCAQRKPRRPVKRKALLCRKAGGPLRAAFLLGCGGCWLEVPPESGSLLPGALYPLLRGGTSPHLAAWVLT